MSDLKNTLKNMVLRFKEQNKLTITFTSNDGGNHISDYSKKKIVGPIIILTVDLDNGKTSVFKISQDDHKEIFGNKLG